MIENFYEYLSATWLTPEGCLWASLSVLFLMGVSFALGFLTGRKRDKSESAGSILGTYLNSETYVLF